MHFAQVLGKAYDALLLHGVNYKNLPEYKDDADLDLARKMKPSKAQEIIIAWLTRLEDAVDAAVRRKTFGLVKGGVPPRDPKKH